MSVEQSPGTSRRWIVFVPLLAFLLLAGLFLLQLMSGRDTSTIPSALIGQAAPQTSLPPLEGTDVPGFDNASLEGEVTLVNVWASWCAPCRQEHPLLMQLTGDERFRIVGMNYKDKPANARRFLGELGSPYDAIGVDDSGRTAINWGVYGVPETFLVGRNGVIRWKHVGPFTPESIRDELMPQIEKALSAG